MVWKNPDGKICKKRNYTNWYSGKKFHKKEKTKRIHTTWK